MFISQKQLRNKAVTYRERKCPDTIGTVRVPWAGNISNVIILIYFHVVSFIIILGTLSFAITLNKW